VFIYGREEDANGRGKEIWWDNVAKRKNEEDLHASHDEAWSRARQREERQARRVVSCPVLMLTNEPPTN
jgi:hypothetical protein